MKEILVCFHQTRISMLIPKGRGDGFLKVPLGHHDCPLSRLAYQIGYDLSGLDGALEVETGYIVRNEYPVLLEKAVKPVAQLLGMPWRIVEKNEYWANHPTKTPAT